MKPTIRTGDRILVNKLHYGTRLPKSLLEIPLVNIICYFFMSQEQLKQSLRYGWWRHYRLPALTTVKREDIMVFNLPINNRVFILKRCIGLPNDTLQIINSNVIVNARALKEVASVQKKYNISFTNRTELDKSLDSLSLSTNDVSSATISDKKKVSATLNQEQKVRLLKNDNINSIAPIIELYDSLNNRVYPRDALFTWSRDNFGPIIVPTKGMEIVLNRKNYILYKKVINEIESAEILEIDMAYYQNNKKVNTYTFQQDYYFMMGDNRSFSMDSRFWGFVPEAQIVGKAICVLYSEGNEGIRWNRILQHIN